MIDSDEKRRKALSMFELADVWGIGPRTFAKLAELGVTTPLQFADKPGEWVRRHFHKPLYQTWMELNGYPCIDTAEIIRRQTITTSRSFGKMISSKEDLKASVASFAASCCSTLREGRDPRLLACRYLPAATASGRTFLSTGTSRRRSCPHHRLTRLR